MKKLLLLAFITISYGLLNSAEQREPKKSVAVNTYISQLETIKNFLELVDPDKLEKIDPDKAAAMLASRIITTGIGLKLLRDRILVTNSLQEIKDLFNDPELIIITSAMADILNLMIPILSKTYEVITPSIAEGKQPAHFKFDIPKETVDEIKTLINNALFEQSF